MIEIYDKNIDWIYLCINTFNFRHNESFSLHEKMNKWRCLHVWTSDCSICFGYHFVSMRNGKTKFKFGSSQSPSTSSKCLRNNAEPKFTLSSSLFIASCSRCSRWIDDKWISSAEENSIYFNNENTFQFLLQIYNHAFGTDFFVLH